MLTSSNLSDSISQYKVVHAGNNPSDHSMVSIICNVDVELHCVLNDVGYVNAERVRWNKATNEEGSNY